ncbi:MAG: glutamine amidotransferase, partial [Gammaproteobacteria bacterium]
MCGIAGLIHRGKSSNVGSELQQMLQALKHRGPDSTGYALYAENDGKNFIMRFKVGENVGEGSTSVNEDESVYDERRKLVDKMLNELGATVVKQDKLTPYSFRYEIQFDKDLMEFSKKIESIENVEILSIGKSLELIKDLGDAKVVSDRYGLGNVKGTHAIGHARMATESGVDIKSAHPFWGYPFSDVSVVHNGQLTNYWNNRRVLENKGMRFMSECDSELIAVYLAEKMRNGATLEEGMKDSLSGLDGVFTYFVATKDSLGMAKDTMAAK